MYTALVGRAQELDALMTPFDEARADRPRIVLVEGEAGIGKSRLVAALNHVQHILTKLDLGNRTQVAAWHREQHHR